MYTYAYNHVYTFIHTHTSNPRALPFVAFIQIKAMCWDITTYEHICIHIRVDICMYSRVHICTHSNLESACPPICCQHSYYSRALAQRQEYPSFSTSPLAVAELLLVPVHLLDLPRCGLCVCVCVCVCVRDRERKRERKRERGSESVSQCVCMCVYFFPHLHLFSLEFFVCLHIFQIFPVVACVCVSVCMCVYVCVCERGKVREDQISFKSNFITPESNFITPVARWILREEILSSNLQARFCKLYPADFSVAI